MESLKQGLLSFLTLYDTGDHFTKLRKEHLQTLAELEEAQRQTEELVDAMSELIYVVRYSPTKKPMEKLAIEKDEMFHPLLWTQQRRENNKKKLDLLIESLIPVKINKPKTAKTYKRCQSCFRKKLEKCFRSSQQCLSCHRREQFPRCAARATL